MPTGEEAGEAYARSGLHTCPRSVSRSAVQQVSPALSCFASAKEDPFDGFEGFQHRYGELLDDKVKGRFYEPTRQPHYRFHLDRVRRGLNKFNRIQDTDLALSTRIAKTTIRGRIRSRNRILGHSTLDLAVPESTLRHMHHRNEERLPAI